MTLRGTRHRSCRSLPRRRTTVAHLQKAIRVHAWHPLPLRLRSRSHTRPRDSDRRTSLPRRCRRLPASPEQRARAACAHGAEVGAWALTVGEASSGIVAGRTGVGPTGAASAVAARTRSPTLKTLRRPRIAGERPAAATGPVAWPAPRSSAAGLIAHAAESATVAAAPSSTSIAIRCAATPCRARRLPVAAERVDHPFKCGKARRERCLRRRIAAATLARHRTAWGWLRSLGGVVGLQRPSRRRHPQQDAGRGPLPALAAVPGGFGVPLPLRRGSVPAAAHGRNRGRVPAQRARRESGPLRHPSESRWATVRWPRVVGSNARGRQQQDKTAVPCPSATAHRPPRPGTLLPPRTNQPPHSLVATQNETASANQHRPLAEVRTLP